MRAIVVGGGPAGACAAALLAQEGAEVCLLERARFPRHHVGESLQPATFTLLHEHLGLGPLFAGAGFARKYGAVYVWGESREPWSVLFDERLERDLHLLTEADLLAGGYEHAWQVRRDRFDAMLLAAAKAAGAEVREGCEAHAPWLEGERAVGVVLASGEHLRADVVIDASGQRGLIAQALGLRRRVSDLQSAATYSYVQGAGGAPGPLGRQVQWVVSLPEGWAWFIPVGQGLTSVGVVTHERGPLPRARFLAAVAAAGFPLDGARWEQAQGPGVTADGLRFARDWSFTATRFAGEGWYLVGDAACFVDPILSGGVDLAVRSGFRAALAALRGHAGEDAQALAADYDTTLRRDYRAYLRLARYWYGNNRSVDGLLWQAHREIPSHAVATPMRAFVYLTTGRYASEQHLRVFQRWQEEKMFRALGVDAGALRRARLAE